MCHNIKIKVSEIFHNIPVRKQLARSEPHLRRAYESLTGLCITNENCFFQIIVPKLGIRKMSIGKGSTMQERFRLFFGSCLINDPLVIKGSTHYAIINGVISSPIDRANHNKRYILRLRKYQIVINL